MNFFEKASTPPPPSPFTVIGHYGKAGKFKVWVYGQNRIMTREQVIRQAKHTRAMGGQVTLRGFIDEKETASADPRGASLYK